MDKSERKRIYENDRAIHKKSQYKSEIYSEFIDVFDNSAGYSFDLCKL